jgi:hypothetical protein
MRSPQILFSYESVVTLLNEQYNLSTLFWRFLYHFLY